MDRLNKEYLKETLKERAMTMGELSTQMGFDKSYVSGICNGKIQLTAPVLKLLSMILQVSEEELIIKETTTVSDPVIGKTTIRPVAPEQMDALISAINSEVEVLDRLYTMLDTKLDGIISLGTPLGRLNNNFYDYAVYQGMPDTRPRRNKRENE